MKKIDLLTEKFLSNEFTSINLLKNMYNSYFYTKVLKPQPRSHQI